MYQGNLGLTSFKEKNLEEKKVRMNCCVFLNSWSLDFFFLVLRIFLSLHQKLMLHMIMRHRCKNNAVCCLPVIRNI